MTEPFAGAPSAGFGSVWVRDDNTVTRFNPATGRAIARLQVPGVVAVAFGDGRVWAVSQSANTSHSNGSTATLIQIDPRSNRVVGTPSDLQTSLPVAIAVSGHDLWIADYRGALLHFKLTHP
jgi:outer membrane protein assembly factor BamB